MQCVNKAVMKLKVVEPEKVIGWSRATSLSEEIVNASSRVVPMNAAPSCFVGFFLYTKDSFGPP